MSFTQGHALLIGVGTYRNAPELDVPITADDAKAVAAVLRNPDFCGYPPDQIQTLHGSTATRDGILAAFDQLAMRAGEDDTLFFFFSGHGTYGTDGDYYLTTHDTRAAGRKVASGTGIRQSEFIERLRAIKAKRLLMLINACHSGHVSPVLSAEPETLADHPFPSATTAALLGTGEGRIIITACRETQFSYIGNGPLTLFTQALVEGLQGTGTVGCRGYISAFDLYTNLYLSVEEKVRDRFGETQEPELTVLKGVGPFAVALYRGATDLGIFEPSAGLPEGMAAREVTPDQAQARLNQIVPQAGNHYEATLTGNGAIVQGDNANAVGAGGVMVGGNNSGSINTGTRIDTGGGAWIGGPVSAGGDIIGRDKTVNGAPIATGAAHGSGNATEGQGDASDDADA